MRNKSKSIRQVFAKLSPDSISAAFAIDCIAPICAAPAERRETLPRKEHD